MFRCVYIDLTCFTLTNYQLDIGFHCTLKRSCSIVVDMKSTKDALWYFSVTFYFTSNTFTVPLAVRGFRIFVEEIQRKRFIFRALSETSFKFSVNRFFVQYSSKLKVFSYKFAQESRNNAVFVYSCSQESFVFNIYYFITNAINWIKSYLWTMFLKLLNLISLAFRLDDICVTMKN